MPKNNLRTLHYVCCVVLSVTGCGTEVANNDVPESVDTSSATTISESDLVSDAAPRNSRPDDWFRDVSAASGVDFCHSSGRKGGQFTMLEAFGSGVGLLDFDSDGDLDLLCAGGGTIDANCDVAGAQCRLFRNDGEFRFTDVTAESGLGENVDYSHGVAIGDVNHDSRPDVFISCFGQSRLFVNVDGLRFEDATNRFSLNLQGWHTAACFADVNGDGRSDLFVTGYLQWSPDPKELCLDPHSGLRDVCMPGRFAGESDRLFLGNSQGGLDDATNSAGILPDGKGLGVVVADFNGNGLLDIYVANDVVANHLYINQGDDRFLECAATSGVAGNEYGAAEGSMGVDVGDFNRDGLPDITVTNYEFEDNDVYRNEGGGVFSHVTVPLGLSGPCRTYVGFGTVWTDLDMDGWEDLVVVNGHVTYRNRQSEFQQPAFVFRNELGTRFPDVTDSAAPWFSVPHSGRGLAVGDLNNDGAPDLVISELDGPVTILQNTRPARNWIGIQPRGTISCTDAVGAKVHVVNPAVSSGQFVKSGGSYLSHGDRRLRFPLDDLSRKDVDVEIQWPTGVVEKFSALATNKYHIVKEGRGTSVENTHGGD